MALLLGLFSAAGCAHRAKHSNQAAGTADTAIAVQVAAGGAVTGEHLGTVEVIGTRQRFVLIETPALQPVATLVDGQALVCRAAGGATASLRVSHERRPPFVVADVTSGEPHVGDEVFFGSIPAQPAPGGSPSPSVRAAPTPVATPDFRANPGLPPGR